MLEGRTWYIRTRIKKMTDMKKKIHEIIIHVFRVLVASLMLTPGVYVGVNVRSEFRSVPTTPFPFVVPFPLAAGSTFSCSLAFLRAASDRKDGRAIWGRLATEPISRRGRDLFERQRR
jgi:hypothetical protein